MDISAAGGSDCRGGIDLWVLQVLIKHLARLIITLVVLSGEFGWDDDGVDILGTVPINTGKNFVRFPIHHKTLHYLRRTTTTAV